MVLSPYLPHRRVGHGGGTAVRGLVRHLARRHDVALVSLVRPGEDGLVPGVRELGAEVIPLPYRDRRSRGAGRLALAGQRARAWLRSRRSGYPYYVEKYWSRRLERQVLDAVATLRPDAVQVEYLQLSLFCRALHRSRAAGTPERPRLVLNTHELGSLPRRRRATAARGRAARDRHRREAEAWERLQRDATGWADATLCVTDQDRELLAAQGGRRLRTVPLGMDLDEVPVVWEPQGPPKFLFVGSFEHRPNRLAAKILVDKVWPRVSQYSPTGQLILAGRGSEVFLRSLGREVSGIVALGFVEDLTDLYRECRLFVAPLPQGGGIKIKILEAMARGIPVVTTAIGAEGIVDRAEDALFLAEPDAAFAESMIQALQMPEETRRRGATARRIIEERFSWSAITEVLTSIYEGR
jgi:glycosyltransferase involved in cell wall biosynthesis